MENKTNNVNFSYPQENIRNKAKQRHYIGSGPKKLITKPFGGLFALLLFMSSFFASWKVLDIFIPSMTTISLLIPIVTYVAHLLIPTILLLLSAGFLYLLGSPHKSQEIENDVASAFGLTKTSSLYYKRPFLISKKAVNGSSAIEYVFWSRWIALDQWNKPENKKDILWALRAYSDEEFTNGEKKYTIVIRAVSGVEPKERETPQDPFFKY